jgi:hypothetical protein
VGYHCPSHLEIHLVNAHHAVSVSGPGCQGAAIVDAYQDAGRDRHGSRHEVSIDQHERIELVSEQRRVGLAQAGDKHADEIPPARRVCD